MSVQDQSPASRAFTVLGTLSAAALTALAWTGRDYYSLPAAQRALHEAHAVLRSSGARGLPCGIIGFVLIVLNLGYLVRRAFIRSGWMGSLRDWMSLHVFTGLIGSLLILLHSAFQPRSPMGALSFFALWVVVVTGIVGRYIYAHVPRSVQGQELELSELERLIEARRKELVAKGLRVEAASGARAAAAHHGIAAVLASMVEADREAAREYANLRRAVEASPELTAEAGELLPLAGRFVKEKQWLARYEELRDFMGAWRFFHRWFAIVMLCVAVSHILVATGLGGLSTGLP